MRYRLLLLALLLSPVPASGQVVQTVADWINGPTYPDQAIVKFNGTVWICSVPLSPFNCGFGDANNPANNAQWNALSGLNSWNSTTTYPANKMVMRNGTLFIAVVDNTGCDPAGGLHPECWSARSIPSSPTFTTLGIGATPAASSPAVTFGSIATMFQMTTPPNETGTSVRFFTFGPTNPSTTLLNVDFKKAPPGTNNDNQGGGLVMYSGAANVSAPVSGLSVFLMGSAFTGGNQIVAGIEIENKVNNSTFLPELWIETQSGPPAAGHPIMRITTPSQGSGVAQIRTHDQPNNFIEFMATANGGPSTYASIAKVVSAAIPYWQFPQLTGAGNAALCVDATGKVFRGSPGC